MVLVAMIMMVLEVLVIHSTGYGFYRIFALGFWSIFLSLQILGGFKFGYFFNRLTSPGSQPERKSVT